MNIQEQIRNAEPEDFIYYKETGNNLILTVEKPKVIDAEDIINDAISMMDNIPNTVEYGGDE